MKHGLVVAAIVTSRGRCLSLRSSRVLGRGLRYSPGMKAGERSRFVLGVVAGFALGNAAPAVAVPAIALLVAGCAASALRARRGAAQHGWEVFLRTAALWASACLLVGWVSD